MADLDLQALPPELQTALERAWPGCPEAQRRAVLGPMREGLWQTVWPDNLWPWQPAKRWWRPGQAQRLRDLFEWHFKSQRRNILQAAGPRLFDPAQPFFDTPWTQADVQLRSPVPQAFSDAEFWGITQQMFDGDVSLATSEVTGWARDFIARGATASAARRSSWWIELLAVERASATGDLGGL
jgi:hypothetical protein